MIDLFSALLAIVPMPQASAVPAPTKWSVVPGPTSCGVTRRYDTGTQKVTLLVVPPILTGKSLVSISVPGTQTTEGKGTAPIQIDGYLSTQQASMSIDAETREASLTVSLPPSDAGRLLTAKRLSMPLLLRAQNVTLSLAGYAAAIDAMSSCRNERLAQWGIDPAALARIVEPPIDKDEDYWFSSDDYPVEALKLDSTGSTSMVWEIDQQGRARNCRIVVRTGSPDLNKAACAAIMRRARYTPARDAAGRPVAAWDVRTVNWQLPQ